MEGLEEAFMGTIDAALAHGQPLRYIEIGLGEGTTFLAVRNHVQTVSKRKHLFIGYERLKPEFDILIPRLLRNGITISPVYTSADNDTLFVSDWQRPNLSFLPECANVVFIDGCHCYNCVKNDLLICRDLPRGSFIMLHDAGIRELQCDAMQCSGPLAVHTVLHDMGILGNKNEDFEYLTTLVGARTLVTIQVR